MERESERKIILVIRRTRLEELIARYNTVDQAKFYIEHMGSDFSDYLQEDTQYKKSVEIVYQELEGVGRVQILQRGHVPNFIFGENDIVVVIGQDGLVANTLKYLDDQLLIGVNPDPARWDGILLPFTASDIKSIVRDVLKSRRQVKEVSMAKASLNDGQVIYAVNDLFIGQRSHISSRYHIRLGDMEEYHSSSGIIVSTGLGSSGWLKSILAGASGIWNGYMGNSNSDIYEQRMPWNADYLYFSVREPFPSKRTGTNLIFGTVSNRNPLKILSLMPENGVIFSDGVESDFIQFNSGIEATIQLAEKRGRLVV